MTSPDADAVAIATRVMRALTGRRWTWPKRRVVEQYWVPQTVSEINLSGRPVKAIDSVVGRDNNPLTYELSDGFRLRLPQLEMYNWTYWSYPGYDFNGGVYPAAWRRRMGTPVTVDYTFGNKPPIDIDRAITQLATELSNLFAGRACALPERVTSVSREGINWTIIDPQQFLEGGRTGLYYPDLVLSTYGKKTAARTRVFSPEHLPPRRLSIVPVNS